VALVKSVGCSVGERSVAGRGNARRDVLSYNATASEVARDRSGCEERDGCGGGCGDGNVCIYIWPPRLLICTGAVLPLGDSSVVMVLALGSCAYVGD